MSSHEFSAEYAWCLSCGASAVSHAVPGGCPPPKPVTTLPPGPESVGTAEFERKIEEEGEEDARRANLAKVFQQAVEKGRLCRAYDHVGPNARKILLDVARRLEKGAVQYGDFDGKNADRDWDQETYEEHLDAVVYQAAKRVLKR